MPKVHDKDKKIKESLHEYLGIDYISLIPYLTAAIQERQKILEELKSQVESLFKRKRFEKDQEKSILLYQVDPKPFDQATSIKYSLSGELSIANIFSQLLMEIQSRSLIWLLKEKEKLKLI